MAGVYGADIRRLTLRQLCARYKAKLVDNWNYTATLVAHIYSNNPYMQGTFTPSQFHPFDDNLAPEGYLDDEDDSHQMPFSELLGHAFGSVR